MTLAKDDLRVIGGVVGQKIHQSEHRIEAENTKPAEEKFPTLEELAGSVTPLQPEKELETVIREAKEAHYQERHS